MAASPVTGTQLALTVFDHGFGAHSLTSGTSLTGPGLSFPVGAAGQASRNSGFWAVAADNLRLLPVCQESPAPQARHPPGPVSPSPGFNFSPHLEGKSECSPLRTEALGYLDCIWGAWVREPQDIPCGGLTSTRGAASCPDTSRRTEGQGRGASGSSAPER